MAATGLNFASPGPWDTATGNSYASAEREGPKGDGVDLRRVEVGRGAWLEPEGGNWAERRDLGLRTETRTRKCVGRGVGARVVVSDRGRVAVADSAARERWSMSYVENQTD